MGTNASQLQQAGLRATVPRLHILEAFEAASRPLSIDDLWGKVRRFGVDRVTVYRTAEALSQAGLVRSVDLQHGHSHYERNNPDSHHHHLVCRHCGKIQDVPVAREEQILERLARRYQFHPQSHSLEIFGLCAKCQPRTTTDRIRV